MEYRINTSTANSAHFLWASARKRRALCLVFGLLLTSSLYLGFFPFPDDREFRHGQDSTTVIKSEESEQAGSKCKVDEDTLDPSLYVIGPPTQSFRDNLRNDTKYITTWYGAGWTNDVMTMANMIYLAKITDRIPIIPSFTPDTHVGSWEVEAIRFSDIFDVPRLSKAVGLPLLEWYQVKDPESEEIEDYGCWSIWTTIQKHQSGPRVTRVPLDLKLDVSYTPVPEWVPTGVNSHTRFWKLAPLLFPETRARSLTKPIPSSQKGLAIPPDDQVACFDYLYFIAAEVDFEFEHDFSPAWRHALVHFRWSEKIENIAAYYLRRALKVSSGSEIPPYITIHARHGDFERYCTEALHKCFSPVSSFADAVSKIQREIAERDGIIIPNEHVIMTSDEEDPEWWDVVASFGFRRVDYEAERVVATFGPWYPTFIDAVIQSGGAGFVGSEDSTMSLIASRRVRDWHGGITRIVPWTVPIS